MEIITIANWLNTTFSGFDHFILNLLHNFATLTGGYLNWLFKLISLFGEKGAFLLVLAVFLMLFKKTRKVGICVFGAIGCGAIITNFILKDLVARPRPFMSEILEYKDWWKYAGSVLEDDFSFPSGHATAISAAMMSIFFFTKGNKKYLCILFIVLMGLSRNYLMVHYPTDVIGGIIVGTLSAIIAFYITKLIYYVLNKYNNKFFDFVKNFDIVHLIKSKKKA